MQVLEGILYLGNLQQLGAEIATAFTNALDETCLLQVGLLRRSSLHFLEFLALRALQNNWSCLSSSSVSTGPT